MIKLFTLETNPEQLSVGTWKIQTDFGDNSTTGAYFVFMAWNRQQEGWPDERIDLKSYSKASLRNVEKLLLKMWTYVSIRHTLTTVIKSYFIDAPDTVKSSWVELFGVTILLWVSWSSLLTRQSQPWRPFFVVWLAINFSSHPEFLSKLYSTLNSLPFSASRQPGMYSCVMSVILPWIRFRWLNTTATNVQSLPRGFKDVFRHLGAKLVFH